MPSPETATGVSGPQRALAPRALMRRALAIWPRLSPRALTRCGDDPARLAAYVARRTKLPPEVIRAMLAPPLADVDAELWFG